MHAFVTSKNVKWCHLIWPTLYNDVISPVGLKCELPGFFLELIGNVYLTLDAHIFERSCVCRCCYGDQRWKRGRWDVKVATVWPSREDVRVRWAEWRAGVWRSRRVSSRATWSAESTVTAFSQPAPTLSLAYSGRHSSVKFVDDVRCFRVHRLKKV